MHYGGMRLLVYTILCSGIFLLPLSALEKKDTRLEKRVVRTFTNQEGKAIEAELVDVKDGKVSLIMNRRPFEIPMEMLSAADQEFLTAWDAERKGNTDDLYYSELIFSDDFQGNDFGEAWSHYKSKSVVKGGVLIGKTIDINDHAGVDAVRLESGHKDMEVSVKFNFAGEKAERFNVWFDDHGYKGSHAGHICSVTISPERLTISDAKTGNFEISIYEKRSSGQELDDETKQLLQSKTTTYPLSLKRNEWHTLRIRTKDKEVTVTINDYDIGKFKSDGIGHETKSVISLTTNIDDVQYDDFVIKAAKPSADAAPAEDTAK